MKKEMLIRRTVDCSGVQAYVYNPLRRKWVHAGRVRQGYSVYVVVRGFLRGTMPHPNHVSQSGGGSSHFGVAECTFPYITSKEWQVAYAALCNCR